MNKDDVAMTIYESNLDPIDKSIFMSFLEDAQSSDVVEGIKDAVNDKAYNDTIENIMEPQENEKKSKNSRFKRFASKIDVDKIKRKLKDKIDRILNMLRLETTNAANIMRKTTSAIVEAFKKFLGDTIDDINMYRLKKKAIDLIRYSYVVRGDAINKFIKKSEAKRKVLELYQKANEILNQIQILQEKKRAREEGTAGKKAIRNELYQTRKANARDRYDSRNAEIEARKAIDDLNAAEAEVKAETESANAKLAIYESAENGDITEYEKCYMLSAIENGYV